MLSNTTVTDLSPDEVVLLGMSDFSFRPWLRYFKKKPGLSFDHQERNSADVILESFINPLALQKMKQHTETHNSWLGNLSRKWRN